MYPNWNSNRKILHVFATYFMIPVFGGLKVLSPRIIIVDSDKVARKKKKKRWLLLEKSSRSVRLTDVWQYSVHKNEWITTGELWGPNPWRHLGTVYDVTPQSSTIMGSILLVYPNYGSPSKRRILPLTSGEKNLRINLRKETWQLL